MRTLIIALAIMAACAQEFVVSQEYTDYLKMHVEWEVVDYEDNIFRGWTMEEAKMLLNDVDLEQDEYFDDSYEVDTNAPSSIDWSGANCDHGVRNQGQCGSCWAFAVVEMLGIRCCLQGNDHGFLAPQELVSCATKKNKGCQGGWPTWALDYVIENKGLVHEACFPYVARNVACAKKCADGKDWKASHVCNCVSGYKTCKTVECFKTALKDGPVTIGFGVCRSFFNYKQGIYKCDCGRSYVGLHAVLAMGFADSPCNFTIKNSWGTTWGNKGYFQMDCNTCGLPGDYPNGNVYCAKVA